MLDYVGYVVAGLAVLSFFVIAAEEANDENIDE